MIREIVKTKSNTYVLNLPDDLVGKMVEVIAFEVDKSSKPTDTPQIKKTIADIKEKYSKYPLISHESYQFNRDEAHNED